MFMFMMTAEEKYDKRFMIMMLMVMNFDELNDHELNDDHLEDYDVCVGF